MLGNNLNFNFFLNVFPIRCSTLDVGPLSQIFCSNDITPYSWSEWQPIGLVRIGSFKVHRHHSSNAWYPPVTAMIFCSATVLNKLGAWSGPDKVVTLYLRWESKLFLISKKSRRDDPDARRWSLSGLRVLSNQSGHKNSHAAFAHRIVILYNTSSEESRQI